MRPNIKREQRMTLNTTKHLNSKGLSFGFMGLRDT